MNFLLQKNRQFIVYFDPEMEWLADHLHNKHSNIFVKSQIDWKVFPDGTPNIFVHDIN